MIRAGSKFVKLLFFRGLVDNGIHHVPAIPLHGGEGHPDYAGHTQAVTVGKKLVIKSS